MRISDWSSDVCSSDLDRTRQLIGEAQQIAYNVRDIDRAFDQRYPAGSLSGTSNESLVTNAEERWRDAVGSFQDALRTQATVVTKLGDTRREMHTLVGARQDATGALQAAQAGNKPVARAEKHTAELQSLMRRSYAVFCLKKKKNNE